MKLVPENTSQKTKKEPVMTKPSHSSITSHAKLWNVPKGKHNARIGVKNVNSTRRPLVYHITVVESKLTLSLRWHDKKSKPFRIVSDPAVVCTLTEVVITIDRRHLERSTVADPEIDNLKILGNLSHNNLNNRNNHNNNDL